MTFHCLNERPALRLVSRAQKGAIEGPAIFDGHEQGREGARVVPSSQGKDSKLTEIDSFHLEE